MGTDCSPRTDCSSEELQEGTDYSCEELQKGTDCSPGLIASVKNHKPSIGRNTICDSYVLRISLIMINKIIITNKWPKM
jgi:hypothetical protein